MEHYTLGYAPPEEVGREGCRTPALVRPKHPRGKRPGMGRGSPGGLGSPS